MADASNPSHIKGRLKERLCFWRDELETSTAFLDVYNCTWLSCLSNQNLIPIWEKTKLLLLLTKVL